MAHTDTKERADGEELGISLSVGSTNLEGTNDEHVDNPKPKSRQLCSTVIPNGSLITWAISFPSSHQRYRRRRRQQNGRGGERDGGRNRGFRNAVEVGERGDGKRNGVDWRYTIRTWPNSACRDTHNHNRRRSKRPKRQRKRALRGSREVTVSLMGRREK